MYEIREKQRKLPDGTEITTYTREVLSANELQVEAGTTGYMGGDSGHGGRTYFRIQDFSSTNIHVHPLGRLADEGFAVFLVGRLAAAGSFKRLISGFVILGGKMNPSRSCIRISCFTVKLNADFYFFLCFFKASGASQHESQVQVGERLLFAIVHYSEGHEIFAWIIGVGLQEQLDSAGFGEFAENVASYAQAFLAFRHPVKQSVGYAYV